MGKSTKWFKAVKKAFRSPSKERPTSPGNTKADADEKLLTKHDFPPVTHQAPTPHPLPLFEIISHEVGSERIRGQPLPTPETVLDPAVSAISPNREEKAVEEEDVNASNNVFPVAETHQYDDDDSTVSEEEEAATRIQQRFSSPLALKGLLRLQALVRGYLVRKQAATTLRTMEAIVRVQAVFRGRRVRMSKDGRAVRSRISRAQRHSSRNGVVHGDKLEPLGSEVEQEEANKSKRPTAYLLTQQLKRNTPNRSSSFIDCDPDQPHGGWAWLELWTNARPWENNRQLEDSKDYIIEIIPSSRKNSQYTTKEVDVNTKVKYFEDYISDLAPKKTSFSSRPLSEKNQGLERVEVSDWQPTPRAPSPVQNPAPPGPSTLTAHNHRALSKPPPIEVPDTEEDEANQKLSLRTTDSDQKPPGGELNSTPPSPTHIEGDASPNVAPSPQASDAALLSVPETPPGQLDSSGDHDLSAMTMEQLILPEAHTRINGVDAIGVSVTLSDSLSVSNGVHQPGEDTPSLKRSASDDVTNGHASNGHQENGDNKARKGEKVGENGESPQLPNKRTTCRYMAATESAKAKFRSSSNPKTRTTPETPESPGGSTQKRYSTGGTGTGTPVGKAAESPKTAFGTRKTNSFRSPSPKPGGSKEKPRSVDISPARRNSLGGADGKRWRT